MAGTTTTTGAPLRRQLGAALSAVEHDAAEWGISPRRARLLLVLPVAIAGLVAATVIHRPLYRALAWEDGLLEWIQAGLSGGLAVLGFLIGTRLLAGGQRWPGAIYLLAAVGAVFIFGEEISWGQRIFGWSTPEELAEANRQGETNLHNIGGNLGVFKIMMLGMSLVAVALPLAWRARAGDRPRSFVESLFVPPLVLIPTFMIVIAYRLSRVVRDDVPTVYSRYQEVAELAFIFGIFAFAFIVARWVPGQLRETRRATGQSPRSS